jgi:hypothetical protein
VFTAPVGLTANSFKFLNAGDGQGTDTFFYGSAHVQGIGPNASLSTKLGASLGNPVPGSTPVPLPATAWTGLALIGGLGLLKLRRQPISAA